jgi:hypothetical protein
MPGQLAGCAVRYRGCPLAAVDRGHAATIADWFELGHGSGSAAGCSTDSCAAERSACGTANHHTHQLAGPRMSAVTVLSWVLILTTPDRGDAPAYHRSQWTTSSKGRRSGRTSGRSRRSAG